MRYRKFYPDLEYSESFKAKKSNKHLINNKSLNIKDLLICALIGLFIGLILSVNVSFGQQSNSNVKTQSVNVVEIIDGDTVRLSFNNNFEFLARLFGFDAPELNQSFGNDCKDLLSNKLNNQSIRMFERAKDKFNRPLVELLRSDYSSINFEMVADGCGWLKSPARSEKRKYKDALKNAKIKQLMLWSLENPCNPEKFRKGKCPNSEEKN